MPLPGAPRRPPLAALAALALPALPGAAAAKDPCACLNWKQVYKKDMAMCGEGVEYHIADPSRMGYSRRETINAHSFAGGQAEICPQFYKKLDSQLCVNVGPYQRGTPEWFGGSWCYVSNECQNLNGGRRLSENGNSWADWLVSFVNDARLSKVSEVSWKVCEPGKDKLMRDLEVEDVFKICERQTLSLGYCVKAAYPGAFVNFFWWDIYTAWEGRSNPEVRAYLPELLRDAMEKQEPIVIDTQLGGSSSDLVVVRGEDAYYLKFDPMECPTTFYCRSLLPAPAPYTPEAPAPAAQPDVRQTQAAEPKETREGEL